MTNNNSKNCWIIGASNGIGEELAYKYSSCGYNLMISSRNKDKLQEISHQINKEKNDKQKILVSALDVCNIFSLQNSYQEFLEKIGNLDLVIFCSAIYNPTTAINFDLKTAIETIDVNLKGAINLLHVILPKMVESKNGHIAFLASVAGYRGLPQSFAYGASKAGLINLCEGIYHELKNQNINLSVINPGFVKTRLTDKNKFKMPFILTPKQAAEEIFLGIEAKKFEIHFPKKFTYFLKLLRIMPNWLFLSIIKKIS
jgi:short-subunit dehydrogenase